MIFNYIPSITMIPLYKGWINIKGCSTSKGKEMTFDSNDYFGVQSL